MDGTGTVTTIVPVFNRASMLRTAVESVLAQTWRPIEIILVDDGSTDDTGSVCDALEQSNRGIVKSLHQANGGPGSAREMGRKAARGEFLQYLDSDDLLLPGKFALQVRALREHPECGIAYGRTRYRDSAGREIACDWKPLLRGETAIFPHFLRARMWETVTPLYRASVAADAGRWTTLRLEEDWEYDCRVGALGTKLVFVDEEVGEHRDAATDRLSRGDALDPRRLRDRARAHELIWMHARRAGVAAESAEMQHFTRELFLLARQCGAAGLRNEATTLLRLAAQASDAQDIRVYRAFANAVGHRAAGRLSIWRDRLRR
jgi:glycosyltransferase involved in cell wall biosynthesis